MCVCMYICVCVCVCVCVYKVINIYLSVYNAHTNICMWPSGKRLAHKARVVEAGPGLIPGLGGSSEEGNSNPLQYPCLESLMDSQPMGSQKSQKQVSD